MNRTITTVLTLAPTRRWTRHSEGAFTALPDGRIRFAWSRFSGGTGDFAAAELACCDSRDGGLTWSRPRTLLPNEGRWNTMCPSFVALGDGSLGLAYLVQNTWADAHLRLRRSRDGGRTWSKPVRCIPAPGFHVVNNDRVRRLRSGRLVVPAAYHRQQAVGGKPGMDLRAIAVCYLSDDDGRSWLEARQWIALADPASGSGLQEPGVCELPDGRLWLFARSDLGCQFSSFSSDAGETWTPAQESAFVSPCSPLAVTTLADGRIAAVWNDHSGRFPYPTDQTEVRRTWGRSPLVLAFSDDGLRWHGHLVIAAEPGIGYSYPAIHDRGDGHLLIAACAGGGDDGHPLDTTRIWLVPS